MTYIKDILNFTDSFAPLSEAMDFDNCGIIVGTGNAEVTKAVVALDITKEVVAEAVRKNAQLIISHHPVIFNPIKSVNSDSVVYKLAENKIGALCLHTNLDLSPEFGVNTCLADAVGVKNYAFADGECMLIGELENEIPAKEFAKNVKNALNCKGLRYVDNGNVKTVAMCSGSGGEYVELAKEYNADVLLTGEIKHHEILLANELGLSVIDAGHFKTEDIVIEPLCQKLKGKFPDVEFIKSTECTDKVEYL